MRRIATVFASLAIAGCAAFSGGGGGVQESAWASARVNPDTLMRLAVTQLEHHGYTVQALGPRSVMTIPRPVPVHMQDAAAPQQAPRQWVVRVNVDQVPFMGNSRVEVAGFLLPQTGGTSTQAGGATLNEATVVTSRNRRMFAEVETVSRWIADAAKRHGK